MKKDLVAFSLGLERRKGEISTSRGGAQDSIPSRGTSLSKGCETEAPVPSGQNECPAGSF
jgi:hypothetical protein